MLKTTTFKANLSILKNMFEITSEDGNARTGILKTKAGRFETPFFMPVATKATSKYIDADDFRSTNTKTIISNAFVLHLTPGIVLVQTVSPQN